MSNLKECQELGARGRHILSPPPSFPITLLSYCFTEMVVDDIHLGLPRKFCHFLAETTHKKVKKFKLLSIDCSLRDQRNLTAHLLLNLSTPPPPKKKTLTSSRRLHERDSYLDNIE